ncbi:MAG: DNA polymerase III subunit beta [Xanthomonadales bacterium]|nr:DNA polymerase III subunit beta [Xanthomonadales bacterium]
MKFSIQQESLNQPLSQVVGVVERRQTLPVLANFLLVTKDDRLHITGTDMEVELVASVPADVEQDGEITVPARKLVDIVRALNEGTQISFSLKDEKATLSAGRSRFTLSTLPASEFPATDQVETVEKVSIAEAALKRLLDKTGFAMANQDVRYYLNGLLLDFRGGRLRTVATDGHRLALCDHEDEVSVANDRQMIVPRKGVMELMRMLSDSKEPVELALGRNHVRVTRDGTVFTSKLIDGRFPDYQAVIPVGAEREIRVNREALLDALKRAKILSNEKYRGVRIDAGDGVLKVVAHNPQQEEAVVEVEAEFNFDQMTVGFNVNYMEDALNALESEDVLLQLRDANSSCLVSTPDSDANRHVVMPLKL